MTPDALVNIAVRNQVLLERLKAGQVKDIAAAIAAAEAELVKVIKGLDVNLVGELSYKQFNSLLTQLREAETSMMEPEADRFGAAMEDLADMEAEQEARSIGRLLANKALSIPDAGDAYKAALKNPISATGELLQPFVDNMVPSQLKKTEALMRRAHTEGWTVQQAVQGLRGTAARNFKDGITSLKTRQAEALARTALQHTSNAARQETWSRNADVIDGYQWLSTLDSRTTEQCQALDGQKFKLGKGPTPPIHIGCRSTTVPDINDGLDFLDKGATRSSVNGPVAADKTFFEWLKDQDRSYIEETLGPERASLFLDRGLTPEQFRALSIDKKFMPLSNKELRAKLEKEQLLEPQEPGPGTKTGQLWAMARSMKSELGRAPTAAEFLARTREAGFNDATAKTQLAAWKREDGATPPAPKPAPAPAPKPVPVVTGTRQGMPNKGATRQVWQIADSLHADLGREPTRGELLAATKAAGLNDATASTQFAKWRKAPLDGAAPAPKTVATPAPAKKAPARSWTDLNKRFDDLESAAPEVALTTRDVHDRYPKAARNLLDHFDYDARDWKPGTPQSVIQYHEEFSAALTKAMNGQVSKVGATREQFLEVLRRPVSERGSLKVRNEGLPLSQTVRGQLLVAREMFEALVSPDIIDKINERGLNAVRSAKNRASFTNATFTLNLPNQTRGALKTVIHEMTHAIEYVRPDISIKTRAFLLKRAEGRPSSPLRSLTGSNFYDKDEVAFKDKWKERGGDHYMGRLYQNSPATEILTMGIERLVEDPVGFRKLDREYFDFLVQTLNDL